MRAHLIPTAALAATVTAAMLAPAHLVAQDASAEYTAPYQRKALEIYRTLVGIRSAEGQGRVPEVARYLADQLRQGGFPAEDVHVLPFTKGNGEESAGLVVRYRGDDSSGKKPILLLGHMDVVDALPQDWERDPFTLVEENGYFFGRGTSDNKMGVTVLTTTFLRLKAEGFVPTRDLVIAFTGDEETGMISAREMVTTHRDLTDAEFALNADGGGGAMDPDGKPLLYVVQASEKTYATFELTVNNPGGHSSTPRTDNAIYDLATALKHIEAYRFPVMVNDVTRAYLRAMSGVVPGEVGKAMAALAANPADAHAADVLWHEPEAVGITRTTCVATMLRAGHAENALPQSATATVNCRIFPGVAVADVRDTLDSVAAVPGLRIKVLDDPKASPASPVRSDVMEAVAAAVNARFPAVAVIPAQASYGTDGKEIRAGGIHTYGVAGLFMRDKDQFAHGLNERVEVRNFFAGLDHWKILVTRLAGRPATD
jgi:acetylornithine deacetylase/succinyl-diaminopimelate desuccinylase-like protein